MPQYQPIAASKKPNRNTNQTPEIDLSKSFTNAPHTPAGGLPLDGNFSSMNTPIPQQYQDMSMQDDLTV